MKDFLLLLAGIVATYLVQTLIKIAECISVGSFDWKELLKGLEIHAIYFVAIGLMFFIGYLIPDIELVTINEVNYSLQDAMLIIGYALETKQAVSVVGNFKSFFELDTINAKEIEEEVKG